MNKKLLTARHVREMFGNISDMTLWRWIASDDIGFPKAIYINGRRYFDSDEIEAFRLSRRDDAA